MKVIDDRNTLAETWLTACEHLGGVSGHQDFTVLLHIDEPMLVRASDRQVARMLNEFLIGHNAFGNHTVAETIFPGYEYRRRGAAGVYAYPETIYPGVDRHPDRRWGTYAQRILHRKGEDKKDYCPLKDCIQKMRDKKPKHAAYEIGLGFDLATYNDDTDRTRRMGGPCLSHLSFKIMPGARLQLTAIYRSHYYVQRAYGNLLGLARLQTFVAHEVGLSVGPLVCHSTMATLEAEDDWGMNDVKALLARCRAAYVSAGAGLSVGSSQA